MLHKLISSPFQIDIRPLLNRLDQLESRVHDQQNEIDEIDQREKKNEELEHNLESILNNNNKAQSGIANSNRDFLPRSCFEVKASNPEAQSGLYFIDPMSD